MRKYHIEEEIKTECSKGHFFFGFLINPPSTTDNARRWPKMAEGNAVCPKFQMRFELRTAAELQNNDIITSKSFRTALQPQV